MNRLLARLTQDDIARLDLRTIAFERGHVLYNIHEPLSRIYFPHDAVLAVESALSDGRTIETGTIGCEGAAGFFAVSGADIAITRVAIQADGQLSFTSLQRLRHAHSESPAVRAMVGHFQQALTTQFMQNIACNAAHSVSQRLARWLLMSFDRSRDETVELTQEFLAEMLGTTRPTVTLAAKAMQEQGYIDYTYGSIRIIDPVKLESCSCECYRIVHNAYEYLLPHTFRKPQQS